MLDGEVAAIIVKIPSDEICGDIGNSNSTVVILPDGAHSLPNVIKMKSQLPQIVSTFVTRVSLCKISLVSLEDGLYSLEYDPSMSLLQAFYICVAVVSSQKLTRSHPLHLWL
ncbi:Protein of unknown function DUF3527 [Cynara cardunculus var. scolymus]|uniref:Uncharacterized protein n=1 Tax=Cynara cardunculus var. scolymus TaxID=59895 RepID=A0A103XCN4_CYNCS|nr:Protein of unknown function DUF3527 [Cynara cardunculus var. scolymus]